MSIRPEILEFACAVQALLQHAANDQFTSEEAGKVSEYLEKARSGAPAR